MIRIRKACECTDGSGHKPISVDPLIPEDCDTDLILRIACSICGKEFINVIDTTLPSDNVILSVPPGFRSGTDVH